ncbi:hypothetical protein ACFH04_01425 [Streptomyces noboritoensis]|uniref:Uncharacterized protein n=1 Tax=Streptomyces noboritoensis TaxID=67337 RepID=A0ABV6TAX6_9ACTN
MAGSRQLVRYVVDGAARHGLVESLANRHITGRSSACFGQGST